MKPTVTTINNSVKTDLEKFIIDCEKRYHGEIRELARDAQNGNKKLIMIAGPSGSGKTTTAHILRDYLREGGVNTSVLSLDDFYLDEENAPRDDEGKPDFETVHSLDIPEINRCFERILTEGEYMAPRFDFKAHKRSEERQKVTAHEGEMLIVEGLHALNPLLTQNLPADRLFKVYISVNESVYDENGKIILSSRQMRLVRRMSRDDIYRGTSPTTTFLMWESVIKGEEKHLYCFKPSADRQITTLHRYEPCVFRDRVLGLLSQISPDVEDYYYIEDTKKGLEAFEGIKEEHVPQDSLLREFIRGGKYE